VNDDEFPQLLEVALGIPQQQAAYDGRNAAWHESLSAFFADEQLMRCLQPVSRTMYPGDLASQGPWVVLACGKGHDIGPVRMEFDGGPSPYGLRLTAGRSLAAHLRNAELVGGQNRTAPTASDINSRRQWTCRLATCSWSEPRGYRPEHIVAMYRVGLLSGLRRVPLSIEGY